MIWHFLIDGFTKTRYERTAIDEFGMAMAVLAVLALGFLIFVLFKSYAEREARRKRKEAIARYEKQKGY